MKLKINKLLLQLIIKQILITQKKQKNVLKNVGDFGEMYKDQGGVRKTIYPYKSQKVYKQQDLDGKLNLSSKNKKSKGAY